MTAPLEPTFADAVKAIEGAADLPATRRSHWICSLRQIAAAMDKPLDIIPARWTAARFPIGRLHHARTGSNPKTLANHKSNARAALLWFGDEKGVPSRGVPFTSDWQLLRQQLSDRWARSVLSSLMRYCSGRGIVPTAVDEAVIDNYMHYRATTTALASDAAARRAMARAWNACVEVVHGWPARRLVEPAVKPMAGPAWDTFPAGLRADVQAYLDRLQQVRRIAGGKRIRPCKASTIRLRRAELVAFARMAVREGVAIASLTSLAALLNPVVAEKVIDAYWKADGAEPGTYTIDLGCRVVTIARETGCLDAAALERLIDIRAELEDHRQAGLTEKNLGVIRQVLTGTVWNEVLKLPAILMSEARSLREHAPVKAAVAAQIAVAIALLSAAPIRLGNLIRIRLDENLIKPGGSAISLLAGLPRLRRKKPCSARVSVGERDDRAD